MEELVKAKIQQAVNKIVRTDTNVGQELLEDYKEFLVDAVCKIFAALAFVYNDEEEMSQSITNFVEGNFRDKENFNPKGYSTDSYMVASIPVLLPIEVIAMVDSMDDVTLPLLLSQLSSQVIRNVMILRDYDELGDKIMEERSTTIAEALKEKGWIA